MFLLFLTIAPSFFILFYLVKSDRFPEPTEKIIKTFLWGIVITLPAAIANDLLISNWNLLKINNSISHSFLSAGPIEEGLKFLILTSIIGKYRDYDHPVDGIVYCVCLSQGFATLENIYYVYILSDYFGTTSQGLAILRSFSAIPAHAIFGATMGYFFMKYSFIQKQNNLALCLIVPILLHGIYNFFAGQYFIISLLTVIISWIVLLRAFSRLKKSQLQKRREYEKKI